SNGPASAYTSLAAIVRFNNQGAIDVMNGAAYSASPSFPYSPNLTYHVRMAINVPTHTYSVYVTPPGGAETLIATNFAFRSTQATVTTLNYWAAITSAGTDLVCNFSLIPPLLPPPVINSAASATGTVGTAFSYQIAATNSPTSYNATGLPAGLSVNTGTGLISGTPTAEGTSSVTLSAANTGGTGTATLNLTINAGVSAPVITQQPQNQSVIASQTATFSVTVTGSQPLNYQWQYALPGSSIFYPYPGATGSSYTTQSLTLADSGAQFQCVVSNSAGTVTSNAATLTVTSSGGTTLPA